MSFAVKHVLKKEIYGAFRLLSQSSGRVKNVPTMTNSENVWHQQTNTMANHSDSSIEELVSVDESDVGASGEIGGERRKRVITKKEEKANDDHIFLRHLELDPEEQPAPPPTSPPMSPPKIPPPKPIIVNKQGRTPFTTTRVLSRRSGSSYGFSIAWTHPPRIERVEAGLPADQAGLRPGDYVIFVEKTNVVTLPEDEILKIIKSCGNSVTLEVYRKANANGVVPKAVTNINQVQQRSSTACSATTTATASLELTKRRLHLPQVTFTSEVGSGIIV